MFRHRLLIVTSRPYSSSNGGLRDRFKSLLLPGSGKDDAEISTLRRVIPLVWAEAKSRETKARIGGAFGLLLVGKVLNVQVPFLFKEIIERVGESVGAGAVGSPDVLSVAGTVLLGCTLHVYNRLNLMMVPMFRCSSPPRISCIRGTA